MKINNNSKFIFYIILFIIFILIRINHVLLSSEIDEISFKGLAISNCFWPFGVLKETAVSDSFMPLYYLFTGILRNEILIKIFNSFIALANVLLLIRIGKKILNEKTGLFLAFFLSLNHFFLYYTNLIAPYCLIFFVYTLLFDSLFDYFKKPSKFNFKKLNILNCVLILTDTFGFLYVLAEILIIHFLGKRKKIYSKESNKLFYFSFFAFLLALPILITQFVVNSKLVILNNYNGVGYSFSGVYLLLNDYISPYLTYLAPEYQTKSTLGLIYSFILNPDFQNINSIKILITLFYGSILPLFAVMFFVFKACVKNYRLRLLFYISLVNFVAILFLVLIGKLELNPIYLINLFVSSLILFGYGLFKLKDNCAKTIVIICLLLIQVINPDINAFNITISKNYAVLNPIKTFIKEYQISNDDILFIPHQGYFMAKYLKKIKVFDYDDKYLQISKKNGLVKNLSNKKLKTINKKNIHYSMKNYLEQSRPNEYLTKYFFEKCFDNQKDINRIIVVVDKLNSKPVSPDAIIKCALQRDYSFKLKKIDLAYMDLSQNQSRILFDALKSKTLYNFLNIFGSNFKLSKIIEYKKIDNEYYKIEPSQNILKAINSFDSDYVFMIFNNVK